MASKKRVQWPDVLRVLSDDETRSYALKRFRDLGFTADSFGTKIEVRQTVAEGLVRAEDLLEMKRGSKSQGMRQDIATVRRRLELELWP